MEPSSSPVDNRTVVIFLLAAVALVYIYYRYTQESLRLQQEAMKSHSNGAVEFPVTDHEPVPDQAPLFIPQDD